MAHGPHVTWALTTHAGLELYRLAVPFPFGADVAVTTRQGGTSAAPYDTLNLGAHVGDDPGSVRENRRRVAAALDVGPDALMIAEQVHGTQAAAVELGGDPGTADVLVTTDDRVALCVLVADCVPIALCDPVARVLAVVHAGWRGTAACVVDAAIDEMTRLGASVDRCAAAIGPSISGAAYQVGAEVHDALASAGVVRAVVPDGSGRFRADLQAANVQRLLERGVDVHRIARTSLHTDGGGRFFSDRAQRPCGRFALVARLAADGS